MNTIQTTRPRGRPRKVLPPPKPRPPLAHRISQWMALTGWSLTSTLAAIHDGELKAVKGKGKTSPWRILVSEYVRLGFAASVDELIEEHDLAVPASDHPAA
jgi:hypothetical protein